MRDEGCGMRDEGSGNRGFDLTTYFTKGPGQMLYTLSYADQTSNDDGYPRTDRTDGAK
jgi:hypothetical protein